MATESVLARIADNPRLPTPPTLTMRILDRASHPNCTLTEIGSILGQDPALCGKMLKLVNSSLFGLHRPVTSIDRALNLLGLNHVRSLVLGLSLPSLRFPSASSGQMKAYWKNSVTIAITCREMAQLRKWHDPDSEMVAGLLCDMGILLLQEAFPEQYAELSKLPAASLSASRSELEEKFLGVDHATAGAFCLQRWKLAGDLTDAIRYHHDPAQAPAASAERAHLLFFANQIARLHDESDQTGLLSDLTAVAHQRYGMSDAQLFSFLEILEGKINAFAAVIDVDLGPHASIANLFTKATENLTKLAVEASLDSLRVTEEKIQVEHGLKQAQEALQRTEEQLRQSQKLEAIGRLAGGVAHDFNNLLTVILGNCEMLLEMASLEPRARELIETMTQTGQRAADLTRQLLAFGRKQVLLPEVLNLNDTVASLSKILTRLIGDDITLTVRPSADLRCIKADPSQIEQVILNLVVNARDAMPNGGALTIETFNIDVPADVGADPPNIRAGRYAVIAVRDTGHGMDAQVQRKIFEPFFTTKGHGKGTGLGLATVHGIVQQSQGHITVSSEVGLGTVFHVYLPTVAEPLVPSTTTATATEMSGGTETILLAEDRDDVRLFARRALEANGYMVLEACDGKHALQVLQASAGSIHLLITDAIMPRMSGGELARQMTAMRANLKVLFISGNADDRLMREGVTTAKTPYLQKPFTSRSLLAKVREVLAGGVTTLPTADFSFRNG